MGKISSQVSKGLGAAIQEVKNKISNDTSPEELLNSRVEAQKKRHRRTKAEIQAEKETKQITVESESQENSLFEALDIPKEEEEIDNRPEREKQSHKDFEEFCEWEIQKAHYYNKPEPDFDFRNFYEKGQVVYYVRVFEKLGEKEIQKLTLRTVYPRMLIGCLEKGYCQCIGINSRDMVFETHKEALDCYRNIKVISKYGTEFDDETGKKKRKSRKKSVKETDIENKDYENEEDIDLEEDEDGKED